MVIAPRIVSLALAGLALGCPPRRGERDEPATVAAATPGAPHEPAAATPSADNRPPSPDEPERSPEPCAALTACCEGLVAHELCRKEADAGDPLQCVLSIYWADCPGETRPDASGGQACFRAAGGCHDSLLAACEAQGCGEPGGAHGCYVTGKDRRDVGCGDW